jgi:DNA-binding NarL/FixJ family response regulator
MRAGLHAGECLLVEGELDGLVFRTATAAMARAEPDEVIVTGTVRDLVAGSGLLFQQRDATLVSEELGSLALFAVEGGERPRRPVPRRETKPAGTAPNPLTPRERDVALLIARGYTNRQIGAELVISAATAERHVVNILNKLGFHARSQIAVWVAERGLRSVSS